VILYGRNSVREALRGRRSHQVADVWATAAAAREPWLQSAARLRVCSAEEVEKRCGSSSNQGVCAEVGGYPYVASEELLAAEAPLIVVLDQVQDPRNLGSICRTAECVGATGVVIAERRSADVTPTVCKTSAGAVEHLRVARVRNVADFLARAREAGCWCYGASTGPGAVPHDAPDYSGGVVLVLGSEGAGLRPRVAAACDQLIALPLRGRVDSLGVSAAAAALLYGILHSREKPA
jgi:23S rRNA (guanosine2251-2'-O)-methyltransferase